MIKITNLEVLGMNHAIRGMRNPKNSWDKSDSYETFIEDEHNGEMARYSFVVGDADLQLMKTLAKGGPVHAKYRRMIKVYMDIEAPLYWWKEFDTYKVGTNADSCSTMHTLHKRDLTLDDFSCEHLMPYSLMALEHIISILNYYRQEFVETGDKNYWWQMIQLLPSSFNQKRTVELNYEVLANIYAHRKDHKQDEWRAFCYMIEDLPYHEIITMDIPEDEDNGN